MRYSYITSDVKFVRSVTNSKKTALPVRSYKFRLPPSLEGSEGFNKNDAPIVFKASPETLLNIAGKVVDALPLPSVYNWTNADVVQWIRQYGYPQYQNTFRVNLIHGGKLLLLDAAALTKMNIKDFDHVRHIAQGIRALFFFELTKFARSISLPAEHYYELYKLFRTKTGLKFEQFQRTQLFRCMQLLREKTPYLTHWELLEHWLSRDPHPKYSELFAGVRRYNVYKCPTNVFAKPSVEPPPTYTFCECIPPCQCFWQERHKKTPWKLQCLLGNEQNADENKTFCKMCSPPCKCQNLETNQLCDSGHILTCLQVLYRHKYNYVGQCRRSACDAKILKGRRRCNTCAAAEN